MLNSQKSTRNLERRPVGPAKNQKNDIWLIILTSAKVHFFYATTGKSLFFYTPLNWGKNTFHNKNVGFLDINWLKSPSLILRRNSVALRARPQLPKKDLVPEKMSPSAKLQIFTFRSSFLGEFSDMSHDI